MENLKTNETLSERMLRLRSEQEISLPTDSYILIMLDGCRFSKYTKHLNRPFDIGFAEDMDTVSKYLADEIPGCKMVYTQSDEINIFVTDKDTNGKQGWRRNRISKLLSLSASMATAKFMSLRIQRAVNENQNIDINTIPLAYFDSKVWSVDNSNDVYAWFQYRQNDCIRNSISQFGYAYASHNELMRLKCEDVIKFIYDKYGKNYDNVSDRLKYGFLLTKDTVEKVSEYDNKTYIRGCWAETLGLIKNNSDIIKNLIP